MHIVPRLLSNPIITYQDVMTTVEVSYPTARTDMEALVSMGIVRELNSNKNPRKFMAAEIFDVAYFGD